MIYDPFQFFCYYYTEVVKHDPKAPHRGELSAKLTERLSQICRERPKPQIQFAVWKGRNEHRGKETSLAAARPSWSFLTRLRRPLLFRLAGKEGGEKGRLVTFGAFCL